MMNAEPGSGSLYSQCSEQQKWPEKGVEAKLFL
jgi:hypothetical protein